MIRTDRKTGEPILSPKLTADQLHAMANDPGWRPWMRLIAEHPHAWPALIDWWHNAQRQGFDAAGAAPKPPESMRRRRRVAIPSAPLPPESEPEPVPASMESVDETRTAEPEQSHPDDSAEKALKDADGDFAALERVADPDPATSSGIELPLDLAEAEFRDLLTACWDNERGNVSWRVGSDSGQLDTFDFFEVLEEFMGPGEEG